MNGERRSFALLRPTNGDASVQGRDSAEHPRRVPPPPDCCFLTVLRVSPGGRAHRPPPGDNSFGNIHTEGESWTTVHAVAHPAPDPLRACASAPDLSVSVVHHLSEAGRKASLMAGGDGKGVQRLTVQVPSTRLPWSPLASCGQPAWKHSRTSERVEGQVLRHDDPPVFDSPPTVDRLFHLARAITNWPAGSARRGMRGRERTAGAAPGRSALSWAIRPSAPWSAVAAPRRCYLATS